MEDIDPIASQYYDKPQYYDAVSDYRNFPAECAFMKDMFTKLTGRSLASALELACGPSYHGRELARHGVHVIAVDTNQAMVDFARSLARAEALSMSVELGDIRSWRSAIPMDLAIITQFSFGYLLTNEEIVKHLRLASDSLMDDGVYIIDTRHPRKILLNWDDPPQKGTKHGLRVKVTWGIGPDARMIDPVAQTIALKAFVEVTGAENNDILDSISFISVERILLPQEFRALIQLAGCFRLVGYYGDFDVCQPLEKVRGRRLVAVLQKLV